PKFRERFGGAWRPDSGSSTRYSVIGGPEARRAIFSHRDTEIERKLFSVSPCLCGQIAIFVIVISVAIIGVLSRCVLWRLSYSAQAGRRIALSRTWPEASAPSLLWAIHPSQ